MTALPHPRSVSLSAGTRTRLAIVGASAALGFAGAFALSELTGDDDVAADRAARGAAPTVALRFDDPAVVKGARGGAFHDPPVIKGARGAPLD